MSLDTAHHNHVVYLAWRPQCGLPSQPAWRTPDNIGFSPISYCRPIRWWSLVTISRGRTCALRPTRE